MRTHPVIDNEYYHIFNRGNNKQLIFLDKRDYVRFLFLILYFQSDVKITNMGYYTTNFIEHSVFNISQKTSEQILKGRGVELVAFCLMPNHFHFLMHGVGKNGIPRYMQRVLNAYTKYFNTRYKRSGHLFQGPYKAIGVRSEKQLMYLSAYIHRNPRELSKWKQKEHLYPWSSYQDYVNQNRWGILLQKEIIEEQFSNKSDYQKMVEDSGAKELFADKDIKSNIY